MGTSAGESVKNRKLGWALATLILLYIAAIIAFIIVY